MNSNQNQNNEDAIDKNKISSQEVEIDDDAIEIEDKYKFGWSTYSEITNGRFAMLGFLAIILIEFFSHKTFLSWAGIF